MTLPTVGGSEGVHGTLLNAHINVEHNSDGTHDGAIKFPVDGTSTVVLTKFFTGTLDNDATTEVAHGITGIDKILHVSGAVLNATSTYLVGGFRDGDIDAFTFELSYDGTNVSFTKVGTTVQGQKYRIKINYIL